MSTNTTDKPRKVTTASLRKMKAALCELVIEGVPNNIEEQIALLSSSAFMTGDYDLDFIAK